MRLRSLLEEDLEKPEAGRGEGKHYLRHCARQKPAYGWLRADIGTRSGGLERKRPHIERTHPSGDHSPHTPRLDFLISETSLSLITFLCSAIHSLASASV